MNESLYYTSKWKLKKGIDIKKGMIITEDMIEPIESYAVRKVADYLKDYLYPELTTTNDVDECTDTDLDKYVLEHSKQIVNIVHEAEDADE